MLTSGRIISRNKRAKGIDADVDPNVDYNRIIVATSQVTSYRVITDKLINSSMMRVRSHKTFSISKIVDKTATTAYTKLSFFRVLVE